MTHAVAGSGRQVTDRLVPFAAAQKVVGCSRAKIYVLLEQGVFPRPVKVGRNNYFSEQELQAWISDRLASRSVGGCR